MRGHVYRRRRTWTVVWDLERDSRGKRRQRSIGGFATRREAERALARELARLQAAVRVEPVRITLGEFLTGRWLPSLLDLAPNTRTSYAQIVRRHIVPALGDIRLTRLTAGDVERCYADVRDGTTINGYPMAPASIRRIHATLHAALNAAVAQDLVPRNVASRIRLPRAARPQLSVWSAGELRRFLEHAQVERLFPLFLLLATTGLRRGEALALAWEHVDLERQVLAVRRALLSIGYEVQLGAPKTRYGERTVDFDDATAAVLRRLQGDQRGEYARLGLPWSRETLLFTRADGSRWHPESVSDRFVRVARHAGVPVIRLHDLRHTHASLALACGVHLKVVQERLGHSSIAVTSDLYSHVMPGIQRAAANAVARAALGGWTPR